MKFTIYVKVLAAFLGIALVFMLIFFRYMTSVQIAIAVKGQNTIAKGLLTDLEQQLRPHPSSQWKTMLKVRQKEDIVLLPLDRLTLSPSQRAQLASGEIIFSVGRELQFLNLMIVRATAYKRVAKSPYVLSYAFSIPEQIIASYMEPAFRQIIQDLESTPKADWKEFWSKLEALYGYPIHVLDSAPERLKTALSKYGLAFETKPDSSQISTIYRPFAHGTLQVGPLPYLPITARISDIIYYFVLAFFSLGFCLILFLSLLFVRNIQKLYQITQHYSQGHFEVQQKIRPSSVLYGLYRNILLMGARLKELIASHKKLCRFVAHEIRTPLSTMQMASDRIQNKMPKEPWLLSKIESIQEDIRSIDYIVRMFLVYSRMHAREIAVHKSNTELIEWLKALLAPFRASAFSITLHTHGRASLHADIDTSVLKHALNNLLSNAMKFAKQEVVVSLLCDATELVIHVDDDGPGLAAEGLENLFLEYHTDVDTDQEEKHLGLGLSIAEKAVQLHQGRLVATASPLLQGARFTMILPRN